MAASDDDEPAVADGVAVTGALAAGLACIHSCPQQPPRMRRIELMSRDREPTVFRRRPRVRLTRSRPASAIKQHLIGIFNKHDMTSVRCWIPR